MGSYLITVWPKIDEVFVVSGDEMTEKRTEARKKEKKTKRGNIEKGKRGGNGEGEERKRMNDRKWIRSKRVSCK